MLRPSISRWGHEKGRRQPVSGRRLELFSCLPILVLVICPQNPPHSTAAADGWSAGPGAQRAVKRAVGLFGAVCDFSSLKVQPGNNLSFC